MSSNSEVCFLMNFKKDFGFSKNIEKTIAKSMVGTLKFMAPELFEKSEYDYSIDVWSFGIVFFLLLTKYQNEENSKNFYDFKIEENRNLISKMLNSTKFKFKSEYIRIIEQCIEKDPKERPGSGYLLEKFKKMKRKIENEDPITPTFVSSSSPSTLSSKDSTNPFSNPIENEENELSLWLKNIGLEEYEKNFVENGFDDFDFLKKYGLTNQNLDEIGIELPGHRRKIKIKLEELK
jgi:serine/threonine protein kinase